ncbi:hypothetical protein Ssi03_48830 [Sphaerisporangium siamense]|uniref:Lantibiotic dehydratase n=1 Tax=Sphaerisporangium siamense TaxID=795645 RepID=A0A7W7D361_9ACTN|nr:hypothetical protein [Sphaerisporangium siamense]MBB4699480.1 hypothetical protein [Sphaerisporangium siamense]GII86893.1 hypothetical protein Ssi03_48830 [Sphaerisporangium siamense]
MARPPLVERVCGLPVRAVDALAAPETMAAVRQALACRATAEALAGPLGDALYRLVPALAPAVRRAALRIRRDSHNLRATPEAVRARVLAHADPATADLLTAFAQAVTGHEEWLAKAAEAAEAELAASVRATLRWLRTPGILEALALAGPLFTAELLAARAPDRDARLVRSAVSYLTRTALKPSPFAGLATVGVPGGRAGRAVSSSRTAALALLRDLAERPDGPSWQPVVRNPSLRVAGGRVRGLLPVYTRAHGVFFRDDELTDCGDADAWARLPAGAVPLRRAAELMDVPLRAARRMIATGLLLPVTPWALADGRHFTALSAALAAHAAGEDLAGAVAGPARLEAELARAPAADRVAGSAACGQALASAFGRPPRWLDAVPLFHEVVAHGSAARGPDERLAQVASTLTPGVRRLALYDRLVEFFLHRHGAGGTAPDLLAFCYDFLTTAGMDPFPADRPSPARHGLGGHGTLGAAMSTVFYQTAGDLLVVNRVHSGFAGLIARWAVVPELHDALAATIAAWLGERHPGCRVYQWSAHADWVDFQRPALRSLPYVSWGAELAGEGVTDLRGFTLRHDPGTGTLQAADHTGHPAALAYLGAIPPALMRGVERVVHTLCDPWTASPPGGDASGHVPRLERDGVVYRRERWRVAPDEIPRPGADLVGFLAEVERWRTGLGLPAEVFLRQRGPRAGVARPEKPQWLGFDHPLAVWTALRQVRGDAAVVELVEALPGRDDHGDEHATEYGVMVRHG